MSVAADGPVSDEVASRPREVAVALLWCVAVTGVFLFPLFTGESFSVVEARMGDNYPWAASASAEKVASPAQFDSADLSVPWQRQLDDALDEGTLAFWSPDVFGGGSPLFANGTSAQLYPPRVALSLLTPERWFHDAWIAFHLIAGGLATFLLGRELRRSAPASIVGATAWMLGSFNLGWAHLEVVTPMILGLPLALWLVHRVWRLSSARSVVVAAAGLCSILISGHLLWMLFTWELAAVYAACLGGARWWTTRHSRPRQAAAALAALWREALPAIAAFASALALSAVVLLPTLAALRRTPREPFDESALASFMASKRLLSTWLIWPPPHEPMTTEVMNGRLSFVGTATVVLAAVGVFSRRSGSGLARSVVLGFAVVMVWLPAAQLAYLLVPGMNVMYPYSRFAGWMVIGLVVAAMVGFDVVTAAVGRWRSWATQPDGLPLAAGRLTWGAAVAVSILTMVQLVPLGRSLNPPFQDRDDASWFPTTPVIDAALALPDHDGWPARIAPLTTDYEGLTPGGPPILWANQPVMLGLDTLSGYDSTLPEPAAQVLRSLAGDDPDHVVDHPLVGAYVPVFELSRSRLGAFGASGVDAVMVVPEIDPEDPTLEALGSYRVVYSGPDGSLLALDPGGSGPYLATSLETVDSDPLSSLDAAIGQTVPKDAAVVTSDDRARIETSMVDESGDEYAPDDGRGEPSVAEVGTVATNERGINSIELSIEADASRLLVVPVNIDPGWSATVGGESAEIIAVNHSHMGVMVPEGTSTAEFRYLPPLFRAGSALSLAALLGLIVVWFWSRPRRGQRPAE